MTAALKAGMVYFVVVYCLGFVLGTARVLMLTPRLGETAAVLLEAPIILAFSWIASRCSANSFAVPTRVTPRLVMGGTAFALLIIGELAVSILLFHRSWGDTLAGYGSPPGAIGLSAQIAFGLFPLMQAARQRRDG